MVQKVGRYTLALALIVIGGALIYDNLKGTSATWYVVHLWPAILILLGLEWLLLSTRIGAGDKLRVDGGAIVGVVVVALVASGINAAWRGPIRNFNFRGPEIVIPPIPSMPSMPSINPFSAVSDDVVKTFEGDAATLKDLTVTAGSGHINVVPSDTFKVEMHVRGYGRDKQEAEQNAQRVELLVTPGATTTVRAQWPPSLTRMDVDFEIYAPAAANARLDTSSGRISVKDRTGGVYAQSSSGGVQVENVMGSVDLRASSGNITALGVQGDVVVTSSSGSILVRKAGGTVKANATSGTVLIEDPSGAVSAQASSGNVTVSAYQVGGNYDLGASSGHVQLNMPASAAVNVTARATSGHVAGPAWLTIGEGRNSGSGTNGDGTFRVNIRTSSGGIDVIAH